MSSEWAVAVGWAKMRSNAKHLFVVEVLCYSNYRQLIRVNNNFAFRKYPTGIISGNVSNSIIDAVRQESEIPGKLAHLSPIEDNL